MNKEFIKNFKEGYSEARRLGFTDYYISSNNGKNLTWIDISTMIDAGINLPKEAIKNIETNLKHFFQSQDNLKIYLAAKKTSDALEKKGDGGLE